MNTSLGVSLAIIGLILGLASPIFNNKVKGIFRNLGLVLLLAALILILNPHIWTR